MDLYTELRRLYVNTLVGEFQTAKRVGSLDNQYLNYHSILYMDLIHYMNGCTVNGLADILRINKSTVSKKIDELASKGIVYKERDPDDGRVYHIHLHPEAVLASDKFDEPYMRAVKRMEEELTPEELDGFCKALSIVSEELEGDL